MKKETRSIQLPFCGFYESSASRMIDDEIEQTFTDEDGEVLNVPDVLWYGGPYAINYKAIEIELVKAYVDSYEAQYENETGILLNATFEGMTSPREYNFATDRVFVTVPYATVKKLYAESVKDKHTQLAELIKDRCTSYDGFYSYYTNEVELWLQKDLKDWDHNELKILLEAVLNIHYTPSKHGDGHFDVYDLLERWTCNGGLSNAVWGAMPQVTRDFANMQRDYGKAVDFGLWVETGKCYPDGTDRDELAEAGELPPPRCDKTLELFNGKNPA